MTETTEHIEHIELRESATLSLHEKFLDLLEGGVPLREALEDSIHAALYRITAYQQAWSVTSDENTCAALRALKGGCHDALARFKAAFEALKEKEGDDENCIKAPPLDG